MDETTTRSTRHEETPMTTVSRLAPSGTYVLDPATIGIWFTARHAIGPSVHGRFHRVEAVGHLDAGDRRRSRVDVSIDATSVDTGNRRRDRQLRSSFLDSGHHPVLTYAGTGEESACGGGYRVSGELVVRGVTTPLDLTFARLGPLGADLHLTSTWVVSRRELGVVWSSFWDCAVADEVRVGVEAVLRRRPPRELPRIIWSRSTAAPLPRPCFDSGEGVVGA
jgi:polyisoprenoid-binding protein YceI